MSLFERESRQAFAGRAKFSIVILTFNSSTSIRRTLAAATQLSDDIHVVDSFSSDDTVAICQEWGCRVVQHPFKNYSDQRNWAIDSLTLAHDWELHLDADEEMEPSLVEALASLALDNSTFDGFIIGRRIVFLGAVLRFGGIDKTWHCRLFRHGKGRCENRLYDQHFTCAGPTQVINHFMLDHQAESLGEWTARHNRWSDLEAKEIGSKERADSGIIIPNQRGNVIEKKRYYKDLYYSGPLFWRVAFYFIYRYFFRLGFLDGGRGLVYHTLQGFWFRFLVDAKLFEAERGKSKMANGSSGAASSRPVADRVSLSE